MSIHTMYVYKRGENMRTDKVKQVICIAETSAEAFEDKMNEALSGLSDPEILFDANRSFTATIIYNVRRDVPEDVLELFEMIDGNNRRCCDCPHYVVPTDKRRKWGTCSTSAQRVRPEGRACEKYYLMRYQVLKEASDTYKAIPYVLE